MIKGTDASVTVATINNCTVSKHSLRSLRVEWMYKDTSNLWLTDEVS